MLNKNIIESLYSFALIALQTFATIFCIELLYRGGFGAAKVWIIQYTKPFAYNFLLLFLLLASLQIFKRKLYIILSYIITVPLLFLGLASYVKQGIRGVPVL